MPSAAMKSVNIHGHEVSYRMGGDGPAVLLIHGMAGSSRTWKEVTDLLVKNHTVIAPDLLGHGESAKPRGDYSLGAFASGLRDLLNVIGVERATIVGQSLGGGVAMQLSYQHPELVERLVLVGSGGLGREVTWMLRLLTLPGAEIVMPVLFPSFMRDSGNAISGFLHDKGIKSPQIAEMWRAYASLSGAENRGAFLRTLRSVVDAGGQTVSAMDRIYLAAAVPTLIVWGDQDHIIPIEHGIAAHEAIPGSRFEILEGCGHFPHVEQPERFVEILEDFIETTRPADAETSDYRHLLSMHNDAQPPAA
ncbi:MAG TPA: alpha/beta fold hydrolase [Microthrixaceae bacterium]|nr:alpha/beta fold hydrolase [Microthrixaceae bacterium]